MKRAYVEMLGAVAALLLLTGPAAAISLQVDPPIQQVAPGVTVQVGVVISGLGSGAPSLSTLDLDVSFDPSILSFVSFTFGDPILGDQLDLSGGGSFTEVTSGAGVVHLVEVSLDSPGDLNALQADSFALGTLAFTAVSAGASGIGLSVNALGDANGDPLAVNILSGRVEVRAASVPEAPSLLLLLASVVAWAFFAARPH